MWEAMAVFVQHPALAALPGLALLALAGAARRARRPGVGAAAAAWLVYAVYETLVRARVLCSGECNIRVDLLLIYPLLLALSAAALVAAARGGPRPPGA